MAARIRIAIDLMGGDHGLRVSLPAAIKSLNEFPDLDLVLLGPAAVLGDPALIEPAVRARVQIQPAEQLVTMSDKPAAALRHKRDSSMRRALDLLAAGEVDAVVSAGNTGALMAMGYHVLRTLPGIDRPAICSAVPTVAGACYLLDLGANVDSSAEHLYQFALMGSALCRALDDIERPRVALLNVGEEPIKGSEVVKAADALIKADAGLNYGGYVEGDDIFRDRAQVIVCDGFVGNVALKACEGTALHIAGLLKAAFGESWLARLAALMSRHVVQKVYHKLDPQQYNGAVLLGLKGVVVKSHGDSSVDGFSCAIARAYTAARRDMLGMLERRLAAACSQAQ